MTAQAKADTFAAFRDCFAADLAALIGEQPPRSTKPIAFAFIELVEQVRDVPGASSLGNWQDGSEDLGSAVTYLTDALASPAVDQPSLLTWARTHLRDAIATAG
ncbi:hypothetical protein [Streptomyces durhamensis]|uniref:hypothetical protein n=1 Tax=Streptomyces durhamensis TaxID=68194 RepID=UPI0004CCFB7C|nr:hypothetical protein [Streptomyces durhamensis]